MYIALCIAIMCVINFGKSARLIIALWVGLVK